ncbi:hypothetical protein F4553_001478 [Allocatelliglobosispora scoriae]|uniref:Anti-sigma K factor RskA C-terminal domain-containing protein n=1 Tax=Allocatelliglobosispora scoriae TaxID=643052 RepID=A0A841BLM7_9ACTN|nr:anti-sigma factor [Allocatelliglobosispora scoriae]MBB5868099.1 hypothetical protein [Allocatelliglobosispora scoriae]
MPHLEQSELILLASDEAAESATSAEHLAGCAACRDELAELRDLFAVVSETEQVRDLPPPPESVWAGITAQLAADSAARSDDAVPAVPTSGDTAGKGSADRARSPRDNRPAPRARRSWRRIAAAAALTVAVAAAGLVAGVWLTRSDDPARPAVLASAQLAAYGGTPPSAAGRAEVLDGRRLALHVTGLPAVSGYYEVWLIDPATLRMFSVGTLGAGPDGEFTLPANADLGVYRVVDVSAEQFDNNSAHSGDSLLRGTLS